jgi:hypothetical protein
MGEGRRLVAVILELSDLDGAISIAARRASIWLTV